MNVITAALLEDERLFDCGMRDKVLLSLLAPHVNHSPSWRQIGCCVPASALFAG